MTTEAGIRAAVAAADWPTANRLFATYRAAGPPSVERVAQLAALLQDWLAVLEAEVPYSNDPASMPPTVALAAIDARLSFRLLGEARDLARLARERHPDRPGFAMREAEALFRLGEYADALVVAQSVLQDGHPASIRMVTRNLLALDQMEECDRLLRRVEADASAAQRHDLVVARTEYWSAQGDPERALEAADALAGSIPAHQYYALVAQYAGDARNSGRLNALLQTVATWRDDVQQAALFAHAAPGIIAQHYRCLVNWNAIAESVDALSQRHLRPAQAKSIGGVALAAGRYQLSEAFFQSALNLFPSSIVLWQDLLVIFGLRERSACVVELRNRMRQIFPKHIYLTAVGSGDPRTWDVDELSELIAHNVGTASEKQRSQFLASLAEAPLDNENLALLQRLTRNESPFINCQMESLLAPVLDTHQLNEATLTPLPFAHIARQGRRARQRIAETAAAVADEPAEGGAGKSAMGECLDMLATIQHRAGRDFVLSRESFADALGLARYLTQRIRRSEPISAIRIGDGEGHFCPTHPSVAAELEADQDWIQTIWWGAARMRGERLRSIQQGFLQAVDSADVVGTVPAWRIIVELPRSKSIRPRRARGIFNGTAYLSTLRSIPVCTSAHFHHDLHQWNLWTEIFAAARSVSYISGHDLGDFLYQFFGLRARQEILIPAEHRYSELTADASGPHDGGTDTLLDRHDDVCAAIEPRQGEVYLVAAGFLGKIYCNIIRQRGGVAIDIGSLADYWMGLATRRYRRNAQERLSLPILLLEGLDWPRINERERIIGMPSLVRSSGSFRYNIATAADEQLLAATPRQTRLLRVIGHPRCGSGFVATLFSDYGIEIGHERLLSDGISSWMHAVQDLNIPWGDNDTYSTDFTHTVAYVRDPTDAIPSIMLENGTSRSFHFRRLHILRASGQDLVDYRTALDRAVASFLLWYDIVFAQRLSATVRIEDPSAAVEALIHSMGRAVVPPSQASQTEGRYNSSSRKFRRPKPTLDAQAWRTLDPSLRDRLAAFCDRFGYPFPVDASSVASV